MPRFVSRIRAFGATALALAALGATTGVQARTDVSVSIGIQVPGVRVHAAPVYVQPAPVFVHPRPVYVQPAPVYVPPRQVYLQPAPVFVQPQPVVVYPPIYLHGHRFDRRWHGGGGGWKRDRDHGYRGYDDRYDDRRY